MNNNCRKVFIKRLFPVLLTVVFACLFSACERVDLQLSVNDTASSCSLFEDPLSEANAAQELDTLNPVPNPHLVDEADYPVLSEAVHSVENFFSSIKKDNTKVASSKEKKKHSNSKKHTKLTSDSKKKQGTDPQDIQDGRETIPDNKDVISENTTKDTSNEVIGNDTVIDEETVVDNNSEVSENTDDKDQESDQNDPENKDKEEKDSEEKDPEEKDSEKKGPAKPVYTGYAAEPHPQYIVHAGGEYHKYAVTNSIDSFTMAYKAGQRYLEIDFTMTSDNVPVCLHDWNTNYLPDYSMDDFPLTLEEFESAALYGFMTTMTLKDLAGFMNAYNDFYVITDGKEACMSVLKMIANTYPGLRDRFIVQVYDMDTIDLVMSMGYKRIILTLYELPNEIKTNPQRVAELVKGYDLWAITFGKELVDYDGYVEAMLTTNNRLYTHTVNDEKEIKRHLSMGITGVYTDRYFE